MPQGILVVWQRECFPGSCQKWLTVPILDPATLSSKGAGRLQVCADTLEHARLEKPSLVFALVFSSASFVLYQDHFLIWKTPLHFPLPAFPFFPLLPSQVSSVCLDSYHSLCFLPGKHVLVSSVVIQVTWLLVDVQNGTDWGSCSPQLVRLVPPWLWRCNLSYVLLSSLSLIKNPCCIKDPSWRLAQPPVKPAFSLPFFGVIQDFGVSKDWGAPPFAVIRNRRQVPLFVTTTLLFLFFLQPLWNWCSLGNRCSLTLWM